MANNLPGDFGGRTRGGRLMPLPSPIMHKLRRLHPQHPIFKKFPGLRHIIHGGRAVPPMPFHGTMPPIQPPAPGLEGPPGQAPPPPVPPTPDPSSGGAGGQALEGPPVARSPNDAPWWTGMNGPQSHFDPYQDTQGALDGFQRGQGMSRRYHRGQGEFTGEMENGGEGYPMPTSGPEQMMGELEQENQPDPSSGDPRAALLQRFHAAMPVGPQLTSRAGLRRHLQQLGQRRAVPAGRQRILPGRHQVRQVRHPY